MTDPGQSARLSFKNSGISSPFIATRTRGWGTKMCSMNIMETGSLRLDRTGGGWWDKVPENKVRDVYSSYIFKSHKDGREQRRGAPEQNCGEGI